MHERLAGSKAHNVRVFINGSDIDIDWEPVCNSAVMVANNLASA